MNIHNLWFLCLLVRMLFVYLIFFITNKKNNLLLICITLFIGLGFLYRGIIGSNNEIQIAKVFWHETRLIHSFLYLSSSYLLFNNNNIMAATMLSTDIAFSIIYRILSNQ